MRFFVLAFFLLSFLVVPVAALSECTDFLSFQFQGAVKLPENGFDYNTSILSMRVVSARPDGFRPGGIAHDYVYVTLVDYLNKSKAGQVYYQTIEGKQAGDFYFSPLNTSGVPWFCGNEKIENLGLSVERLSGSFYDSNGKNLLPESVLAVKVQTTYSDAFSLQDFGVTDTLYVVAEQNKTGLNPAYLIYDAGNGQYFQSSFKNVRFRIPVNATTFCRNYSVFCLDDVGVKNPVCKAGDVVSYFCKDNACQSNATQCEFGCQENTCLSEGQATPSPSVKPSLSEATATPFIPAANASATPSATPSGMDFSFVWVLVLALLAAAGYYLFAKKRKKGL